jgi:hypothetical protein
MSSEYVVVLYWLLYLNVKLSSVKIVPFIET